MIVNRVGREGASNLGRVETAVERCLREKCLSNRPLKASVSFIYHRDGTVSRPQTDTSSGMAAFDSAVIACLRRAAPYARLSDYFPDFINSLVNVRNPCAAE